MVWFQQLQILPNRQHHHRVSNRLAEISFASDLKMQRHSTEGLVVLGMPFQQRKLVSSFQQSTTLTDFSNVYALQLDSTQDKVQNKEWLEPGLVLSNPTKKSQSLVNLLSLDCVSMFTMGFDPLSIYSVLPQMTCSEYEMRTWTEEDDVIDSYRNCQIQDMHFSSKTQGMQRRTF